MKNTTYKKKTLYKLVYYKTLGPVNYTVISTNLTALLDLKKETKDRYNIEPRMFEKRTIAEYRNGKRYRSDTSKWEHKIYLGELSDEAVSSFIKLIQHE